MFSDPTPVLKTIVELDLARYSDIAKIMEQNLGPKAVAALNEQIRSFIVTSLQKIGSPLEDTLIKETGDGAILAFDNSEKAVNFAVEVHCAASKHNRGKDCEEAQRHFRIGIYSDEIILKKETTLKGEFKRFEVAGTAISNAVRLETACRTGEILICCNSWAELPRDMRLDFGPEEIVKGKRNEKIRAHRRKVEDPAPWEKIKEETDKKEIHEVSKVKDYFSEQWPVLDPGLFGREEELDILDKAWGDYSINILSFVAFGGVGKTALVDKWLNFHMRPDIWRVAEIVYGWSFYSQGAEEGRQASSDTFIDRSLRWFGGSDMADSKSSPWEKGVRLAELIREKKTLLILDGVEPLQEPPASQTGHPGKMKDPAVAALLRTLARGNPGLCIVTTRIRIEDLNPYTGEGGSVKSIDLVKLTEKAGAEYLKSLGVKGSEKEMKEASRDFDGHALGLTLLGTMLKRHYEGDIRRRDEVPSLLHEKKKGGHATRVMKLYEKWLDGTPELDILHIVGLFDRPAEKGAVKALLQEPAISNLTEKLKKLSEHDWDNALEALRDARLISQKKEKEGFLDAHPLVREYFGERLEGNHPEAWKEAHNRLYEYYKKLPEKELPDTVEEMAPLFLAVIHGCKAGKYEEAFYEVYWKRIQRGDEFYSWKKLGAFGADLASITGFFDPPWKNPVKELKEDAQAFLLSEAAFDLRALGRLEEAVEPMKEGADLYKIQKDREYTARCASNLSELFLTLGNIREANQYGEEGVRFAEKSGDEFWKMASRTTLADALFQSGEMGKAKRLFLEGEEIQKEYQPEYPLLYSLPGFRFCDLILSQGNHTEARRRGEKALSIVMNGSRNFLDIALNHLTLGRAAIQARDKKNSREHLENAVEVLRKSGYQYFLPQGLLSRSGFFRMDRDFSRAMRDLEEAWEISTRGGMKLFICDIHIESCRFLLSLMEENELQILNDIAPDGPFAVFKDSTDHLSEAKSHLETASKMIEETGYHRRDPEILLETAHIRILEGKKDEAKKSLQSAKKCIEETGLHSWDAEYARLSGMMK